MSAQQPVSPMSDALYEALSRQEALSEALASVVCAIAGTAGVSTARPAASIATCRRDRRRRGPARKELGIENPVVEAAMRRRRFDVRGGG